MFYRLCTNFVAFNILSLELYKFSASPYNNDSIFWMNLYRHNTDQVQLLGPFDQCLWVNLLGPVGDLYCFSNTFRMLVSDIKCFSP